MQRTTIAERCLLNQYEDHAFTAQGSEEMRRGCERAADSKLETERAERDSIGDRSEGRGNERMVESAGRYCPHCRLTAALKNGFVAGVAGACGY